MAIHMEGRLRRPVIDWLAEQRMTPVFEVWCNNSPCDIVGVHWGGQVGRKIPPMYRIAAIELKLDDAAGVLQQAYRNRHKISESYAAMPKARIDRMRPGTRRNFEISGIGLLSVGDSAVEIIYQPQLNEEAYKFHERMRRKLWRRRDEWICRVDSTRFGMAAEANA